MPRRHKAIVAVGVLTVVAVVIVTAVLLGTGLLGPPSAPAFYSLVAKGYGVALTAQSPTATFSVAGFEGPFALAADASNGTPRATLTVAGEIVLRAGFGSLEYVYPYAAAPSGALQILLVLELPAGANATSVSIALSLRRDLPSAPTVGGSATPSASVVAPLMAPISVGLVASPDLPARRLASSSWTPPPTLDTCNGWSALARGGYWVNVSAPANDSFHFAIQSGLYDGGHVEMQLSGNVTFHAHAPAGEAADVQAAVCKPSTAAPLSGTIDGR